MTGTTSRLVLGGHSFIHQLGSDPGLTRSQHEALVSACLNAGITCFDTTYQPERVALGRALETLGRRSEATVIVWNFFREFGPNDDVGRPDYYRPHHLQQMRDELRTDQIDALVVHGMGDEGENRRQEELASTWKESGTVSRLGTWHPGENAAEAFGETNPYDFMVRPMNVSTSDAGPAFSASKELGWETFACSPFLRGWELDARLKRVSAQSEISPDVVRARLADHMLRHSLFAPNVDRLIVAMRQTEWVDANLRSELRGPLSSKERAWLLTTEPATA